MPIKWLTKAVTEASFKVVGKPVARYTVEGRQVVPLPFWFGMVSC